MLNTAPSLNPLVPALLPGGRVLQTQRLEYPLHIKDPQLVEQGFPVWQVLLKSLLDGVVCQLRTHHLNACTLDLRDS